MDVPGDTAMMASPFKGATLPEAEDGDTERGMDSFPAGSALTSPFAEGLGSQDESSAYAFEFEELVAELAGEEFDEAVEALVDEAAGRHLRAVSSYATQDGEAAASAEVTDWVGAVGGEVDQATSEPRTGIRRHIPRGPVGAGRRRDAVGAQPDGGSQRAVPGGSPRQGG
jgi:hypothetical protein